MNDAIERAGASRRTRDPERKRAAILAAAREVFAERGWAAGTIREIAARAGVTHGLVVLHFATKHDLFVAALAGTRDLADQVQGDRDGLPRRIATAYVRRMESADEADPFIAIVRSATDQDAAGALLAAIRTESIEAYRSVLDVDDVEIRVDLVGTLLIGVTLNRYVLAEGPLAELSGPQAVEHLVGPLTAILLG